VLQRSNGKNSVLECRYFAVMAGVLGPVAPGEFSETGDKQSASTRPSVCCTRSKVLGLTTVETPTNCKVTLEPQISLSHYKIKTSGRALVEILRNC
jgi:hypothetical protein